MKDEYRRRLTELRRHLAHEQERHIRVWEKPTSPEAKEAVAGFIGRIRLEWSIAKRMQEGR